jgi:hypothetical protein
MPSHQRLGGGGVARASLLDKRCVRVMDNVRQASTVADPFLRLLSLTARGGFGAPRPHPRPDTFDLDGLEHAVLVCIETIEQRRLAGDEFLAVDASVAVRIAGTPGAEATPSSFSAQTAIRIGQKAVAVDVYARKPALARRARLGGGDRPVAIGVCVLKHAVKRPDPGRLLRIRRSEKEASDQD